MDPVLVSSPEVILDGGEDPSCSPPGSPSLSRFPPHHHRPSSASRSASHEEPDAGKPSDSRAQQTCPSQPHPASTDDSASQRASAVAGMQGGMADADRNTDPLPWAQRESNPNQQSQPHLPEHNVFPPLLHPQAPSTGARFQPELTPLLPELRLGVCSCQEDCGANPSAAASLPCPGFGIGPGFGVGPCVLVPSCPFLPPPTWLFLPMVPPDWCPCQQTVPVRQPCSPGLLSGNGGEPVSEQLNVATRSAASGKEQSEGEIKSEENQQKNDTLDMNWLQANSTDDKATTFEVSPGPPPSLDEESLADCAFEDYMAIMDSLCPQAQPPDTYSAVSNCAQIHEGAEAEEKENEEDKCGEEEKLETENREFMEFLDELCSDEYFVRNVESTLNVDYLDFLFSSDPEPLDLLALETQEQEEQSKQPSVGSTVDPVTDTGASQVGSTVNNIDYLDSLPPSGPGSHNFFAFEEQEQMVFEATPQDLSRRLSADPISDPATGETSQGTSHVEDRARTAILDQSGTWSDTDPDHDGQNAPLREIGTASEEEPLLTDNTPEYPNPLNASSSLCHYGSPVVDVFTLPLHFGTEILAFDLEATDHDALAAFFLENVSEDASMSPSNLANTQSAQLSQKIQSGPLPGNPPAGEFSTSGVEGSTEDPPTPHFRSDLSTEKPQQSASALALTVPAGETLPLAQIREADAQRSPRNINPTTARLKDMSHPPKVDLDNTVPVPASSSFMEDSHPDSFDARVDGNSSGSVPGKQSLEAPKGQKIPQEIATPAILYELRARQCCDSEKKCEKKLGKGARTSVTPKETATKEREEGMTKKTFERKVEDKENDSKLVKIRRSQRLSDQNKKEKDGLSGEFKIEEAKERKSSEKSMKKMSKVTPEKERVIYEKQSRRSSGGLQLCIRDVGNVEEQSQGPKIAHTVEQFSVMGGKDQHPKLTGEIQRLEVEAGEQCEASDSNLCTEMGAENALSTQRPQEKSERDEGRVKRREGRIQMSSFVRTWSLTAEEKVLLTPLPATRDRRKITDSEMERGEKKASPEREMQDKLQVNVKGCANKELVSSPIKRSRIRRDEEESSEKAKDANETDLTARLADEDTVSGNRSPISLPASSSPRSPRVRTDTPPIKDMKTEDRGGQKAPAEAKRNDGNGHTHPGSSPESPSVKACEKNPKLSPLLHLRPIEPNQQQRKTAAPIEDGTGGHSEVVDKVKTGDFYSLRSLSLKSNASIGTVNKTGSQRSKAAERSSSPEPGPDQTADVKGEEAKQQGLNLSPVKRHRQECGAPEEMEKVGNETETLKSPLKRAKWKGQAEVNSPRAEEQKQTRVEEDDKGSGGKDEKFGICTRSTRSETKAEDKPISDPSGSTRQETAEGEKNAGETPSRDKRSAMKTGTRLQGVQAPRSRHRKQMWRSRKFPSKYKDFILCKLTVRGKARKGRRLRMGRRLDR